MSWIHLAAQLRPWCVAGDERVKRDGVYVEEKVDLRGEQIGQVASVEA